jgi:signal transduction histidine kinase
MRRVRAWLNDLSFTDRVAVGLVLVLIPSFAFPEDEPAAGIDPRSFDAGAVLLLAAAFLALLARKRFPGTTVLVVITLTGTWYLSGYTNGGINIAVLIAFFHLGTTGDRRRQFGVGAVALAMPVIAIALFTDSPVRQSIDAVGYPLAALLFGEIVRSRRLLLDEYAAKARAAELGAEAEAERRVTSERLHIAQDVHDVLAHTVSVMTVQAAAGADALDRKPADPAAARKALGDIRTAGKDAMAELRATVAVLRGSSSGGSGGGVGADQPDLAPAPGLERLPELVDGARAKGLEVELTGDTGVGADGESEGIESLVQLAAYRVVQESLTNVIRHAGASRASVRVEQRPTRLLVRVTDDGAAGSGAAVVAPGRAPVGFGLRGMRERVESLGGSLQFGPRPAGEAGWEVVATLPVRTRVWTRR